MRFGRQGLDPLAIVGQRPARGVGAEGRQEAVVIASAPAEAEASVVEREAGDEGPVDLLGRDFGETPARLGDAHRPSNEVGLGVIHPTQPEATCRAIDPGADQALAQRKDLPEGRTGRDLLGEGRDVEQDGPGRVEARQGRQESVQVGILAAPIVRIKGQDPLDHGAAHGLFLGGYVHRAGEQINRSDGLHNTRAGPRMPSRLRGHARAG